MTDSASLVLTTYTIFDTATGRRLGVGSCLRARLGEVPLYGNQTLLEGEYPQNSRLVGGHIVEAAPAPTFATAADIKGAAKQRLRRTDWMVMRATEDLEKPVPPDVLAERARIRARSNELEARIATTPMTLEELGKQETWA